MLVKDSKTTFIHLKNKTLGEYEFVFRINDGFSIQTPSKISNKYQLLFKKLESKVQQLNLMFVDSIFASILADVAQEVFINEIGSFDQYIESKNKVSLTDIKDEADFLKAKFNYFVHLLIYGDIATNKIFNGEYRMDRVYYLKDENKEIEYFSPYEQSTLQTKLLKDLSLQINENKTTISDQELHLSLQIVYH